MGDKKENTDETRENEDSKKKKTKRKSVLTRALGPRLLETKIVSITALYHKLRFQNLSAEEMSLETN